jgi:CTD small phosphatase-like protein 2
LENKYFHITHNLGEKKEIANDCFDLFNYYYNSSLYHSLLNFFKDPNIIKLNINYTLMSLVVSYDLSFEKEQLNKIYLLLLEMFIINYGNLMLITEFVTNRINKNSDNLDWINLLVKKIIKYKESQEGEDIDSYSNFGLTIIEKIKYNTHYLMQKLHYILLNYDENTSNDLLFFLKTINANSYDKINIFFKENIIRENMGFSSQLASSLIENNSMSKKMNQPKAPYIPFRSKKKYSLVLDLDETLIYLEKIKDENNGTIKIRPGTFSFLEKVRKYYEIIIFSEAEQNYVDLAASSIEENKRYFDYKLYRQHATIENEEFIKDLNKIGRRLSNIIIVDNMPQNFRLQPENGIYIKPFWGKDNEDDVLFGLAKILLQMADDGGDLRDGIKKYKKDIIMNVSLNYKDI